ncbi:MAG: lysophospholipase [Lachnospiraceae bacterium]|nr:lysophospholipase [Lachnospiraceae bacterium]
MMTALAVFLFLILSAFISVYAVYRVVFCHPIKKRPDVHHIPDSNLYRAHREKMLNVIEDMEKTSYEEVSILSADSLRLYGKLFYMKKDAPLIIFFHGFHGTYAWDGYGFFKICQKNGFNILMVDERAHGKSDGNVITFGIKERHDCKLWVEYAVERFGRSTDIFLAGVSMGAASVMMSFELGLPENVRGIIEDCGYSEPAAIIMETIRVMKLPVKPIYQLIKLGARIFGHFDLESAAALQSVQKLNIPLLLIHGSQDSIVPPSMGEELYEVCKSKKERVLIEGADHANSAMTDYETYEKAILQFIEQSC